MAKRTTSRRTPVKKAAPATTQAAAVTSESTETENSYTVPKVGVPRQLPLQPLTPKKTGCKSKSHGNNEVIIQSAGKEISHKEVLAKVREAYGASGATDEIISIKAYIKPEEGKIYYVINQEITGALDY